LREGKFFYDLFLMRNFIIPVAMALFVSAAAAEPAYKPDLVTVAGLEASIRPGVIPDPRQPRAVADYARFYAGKVLDGQPMIVGEFVMPGMAQNPAGIYWVADEWHMPVILEGGCSVVHVLYDVKTSRLVSVRCQGRG
jgi:hypothetical protein